MEIQEQKENMTKGFFGALIGGLIGGASIVLFGQLGIVSALSGLVLAYCTLKGYERLGGELSKKGVWVCIAIMLVMPYLADRVSWALVFMRELGVLWGDGFKYAHEFVAEFGLEADYWKDLLLLYIFVALGAYGLVQPLFKKK